MKCIAITKKNKPCSYKAILNNYCRIHNKTTENKTQKLCNICYIDQSKFISCEFCSYECCIDCFKHYITEKNELICINSECKKLYTYKFISENFDKKYMKNDYKNIVKSSLKHKYLENFSDINTEIENSKEYFFFLNNLFNERIYYTAKSIYEIEYNTSLLNSYHDEKNKTTDIKQLEIISKKIVDMLDIFNNIRNKLAGIWYSNNLIMILDIFIYNNYDAGRYNYIRKKSTKSLTEYETKIKYLLDTEYKYYTTKFDSLKSNTSNLSQIYTEYINNIRPTNGYLNSAITSVYVEIIYLLINDEDFRNQSLQLGDRLELDVIENKINSFRVIKKKYIMRCSNSCKGLVDDILYKCSICNIDYCSDCYKIKNIDHKCLSDDKETIKTLNIDTKPCPKCTTRISRKSGCDQMFCINCKTVFNWMTLELEKGTIHNPDYFEWKDKNVLFDFVKYRKNIENKDNLRTLEKIYRNCEIFSIFVDGQFNIKKLEDAIQNIRLNMMYKKDIKEDDLINDLYINNSKIDKCRMIISETNIFTSGVSEYIKSLFEPEIKKDEINEDKYKNVIENMVSIIKQKIKYIYTIYSDTGRAGYRKLMSYLDYSFM